MPRAQYFVTKRKGEWKIRAGYRYSGPYPTKRKALQVAIDFAERDGQAGREAQVLVQGEDRLFRPAWTYGRDPYPERLTVDRILFEPVCAMTIEKSFAFARDDRSASMNTWSYRSVSLSFVSS